MFDLQTLRRFGDVCRKMWARSLRKNEPASLCERTTSNRRTPQPIGAVPTGSNSSLNPVAHRFADQGPNTPQLPEDRIFLNSGTSMPRPPHIHCKDMNTPQLDTTPKRDHCLFEIVMPSFLPLKSSIQWSENPG